MLCWGKAVSGQLGIGQVLSPMCEPRDSQAFGGKRLQEVASGGEHSLFLLWDGSVFTCGSDRCGQLGHFKPGPRQVEGQLFTCGQRGLGIGVASLLSPEPLDSLSGIPFVQVSAGGDHSFALSLSGAVFAWGKNSAGQLGLNDNQDRNLPCHVSPLNTEGRLHQLWRRTHRCPDQGQLGHDSNHYEPLLRRVLELMGSEVSQIACGSLSPILTHSLLSSREDFRVASVSRGVARIDCDSLNRWRKHLDHSPDSPVAKEITLLLSSMACWNGSFLDQSDDEHFKSTSKFPGIDLDFVRSLFQHLSVLPDFSLLQLATKILESQLILKLLCDPPDVEAMRIYLILADRVLDNWWCWLNGRTFARLVETYKSVVVYLLMHDKTGLQWSYLGTTLKLLDKLHKVNLKAQHLEYMCFYIP
ncbi:hypothetical protein NHX12_018160 [Muraenolepis orangiensis]|uniref:Uncharacterized protein n=1 Tax=Muraenolepis orangiensis TaxID=630683 RepID=A0A9Q0IXA8_9TELE|nr:hypothetical protein NHX12_018160 [Muraenolepis orangiensis]